MNDVDGYTFSHNGMNATGKDIWHRAAQTRCRSCVCGCCPLQHGVAILARHHTLCCSALGTRAPEESGGVGGMDGKGRVKRCCTSKSNAVQGGGRQGGSVRVCDFESQAHAYPLVGSCIRKSVLVEGGATADVVAVIRIPHDVAIRRACRSRASAVKGVAEPGAGPIVARVRTRFRAAIRGHAAHNQSCSRVKARKQLKVAAAPC